MSSISARIFAESPGVPGAGHRRSFTDAVAERAAVLDEARSRRDFETADAVRAELQAEGWTVETTKDGTTVRR